MESARKRMRLRGRQTIYEADPKDKVKEDFNASGSGFVDAMTIVKKSRRQTTIGQIKGTLLVHGCVLGRDSGACFISVII